MSADAPGPRLFGIRHHGPGCARSVRAALEAWRPDAVLVEGPADAQGALAFAGHAGLAEAWTLPKPLQREIDEMTEDEALPYVFSGRSAAHWRDLVAFCRHGGFRVGRGDRGEG